MAVENRYYFGPAYERYWNDPAFLAEQLRPFQGKPVPAGNAAFVENLSGRLAELGGFEGAEQVASVQQAALGGVLHVQDAPALASAPMRVAAAKGAAATGATKTGLASSPWVVAGALLVLYLVFGKKGGS